MGGAFGTAATVGWVLAGIACGKATEAPTGSAAARTEARVDGAALTDGSGRDTKADGEPPPADEDEVMAAARLNEAICRRPRCCVTRVMSAGIGANGTRYTVVRVDLRPSRRGCAPPRRGNQEDVIDPAAMKANQGGEIDEKECDRYRWDLVAEQSGKVRWRQPLEIDHWCTSSFGMGGGEDELSTDPVARTITLSNENGSAWRGDDTVVLGVDPLRVVRTSTRSWWTAGEDEHRVEWNWETFSGTESRSIGFCSTSKDAGVPDEAAGTDVGDRGQAVAACDAVIIPMITLPAAFVHAAWSTTALGGCAAGVDGQDHGFTIHGDKRANPGDAEMRVVMSSGGVLFVEVIDDHLVPTAKSWVKADHLELWRVVEDADHSSGCYQPDPSGKTLQWGIGLGGQVYKAHGAPTNNPTVRVSSTARGARFRIVLPDEGRGLTVVYSDSDDGVRQKRLIATSNLGFGRTWTVGNVTSIMRQRASCILDGSQLRPKIEPLPRTRGLLLRSLPPEFGEAAR